MDKKTKTLQGELRVSSENIGWRRRVELWLLNGEVTKNRGKYEKIVEHKNLFADTPILVAYVNGKIGDGHNMDETINADGTVSESFMSATAERIVGYFRDDEDIRTEEKDGKTWIVGNGYIWEWYARELVDKLEQQGRSGMSVSIETLIDKMHMDGDIEVYDAYQILGTTILGDDVNPAVESAMIRTLSVLDVDAIHDMTLRVASANEHPQKHSEKEKKSMNELETKFGGYKVLCSFGNTVVLQSEEGNELYVSSFERKDNEIVPGSIVTLAETFAAHEADKSALVKANADLESANATIASMTAKEHARRVSDVKNAITGRIAEIKKNRTIAENLCDGLMTDERIEAYAKMEKDGEFCGVDCAVKDVDSLCMNEIIKDDEAETQKRLNSAKKAYAWDFVKTDASKASDNMLSHLDV